MATVNIKIEGISYQVEEGLTILEAAKKGKRWGIIGARLPVRRPRPARFAARPRGSR